MTTIETTVTYNDGVTATRSFNHLTPAYDYSHRQAARADVVAVKLVSRGATLFEYAAPAATDAFAPFEAVEKLTRARVTARAFMRAGGIMFRLTYANGGKQTTIGEVGFAARFEGVKKP